MSPLGSMLVSVLVGVLKAGAVVVLLLLARGLVWAINMLFIQPLFDPLKNMQGPGGSLLQNHFREFMDPSISPDTHEDSVKLYGKTFRFHGFGRHDYRLMSLDLRAISYILNSSVYEKPWQTRSLLSRLLGKGIFAMEGEEHKVLRKLIAPAFSTQSVKAMTPIFYQKAEELRDRWEDITSRATSQEVSFTPTAPTPTSSTNSCVIDVSHWISRATFDVIGLAGFDYHFRSLQDESEEVYLAYRNMFGVADKGPGLKGLVQIYFPFIEKVFPDEGSRVTQESLRVIHNAGKQLVHNKKVVILAEKADAKDIKEKDILSLLIKSNLSSDSSKRLSDGELLDQLSTFLFAGSDSTSLTIAWCIHLLSLHPDIQKRLRDELLSLPVNPVSDASQASTEIIDALPFLDYVVRETLRLCPSVHGTIRVATQDDTIPISSPIVLRNGTVVQAGEEIPIRKGSYVHIPIEGLNMSADIWGEDARTFNPDRWSSLPVSARVPSHPGIANLMTFSFGPHACPGWKFSILETKIFLATLLPHFAFEPAEDIRKFNAILTRPYVYDQFEKGSRLPLKVTKYTS